jgi:hypothetical protein
VFVGSSEASITAAVKGGLGVSALARSRRPATGIEIWENPPLPPVGDAYCGIYLGETGDRPVLEELADAIFNELGPRPSDLRAFTSALMTGAIGRY